MISNGKRELNKALKNKYAIPHFNILNFEYIKTIMLTAQQVNAPVIIAISGKSIDYIGGFKLFSEFVRLLDDIFNIKVPVIIHLDHGTYEQCLKAIEANFTSIMFDGSKMDISENIQMTLKLINLANSKNIAIEAEVGSIGGEEDGVIGAGEKADLQQCKNISKIGITSLAAGINTIHGKYPKNWKGIDFDLLKNINNITNIPIVLHGGSGIPEEQIKKSLQFGIAKMNIGTNLQIAYGQAIKKYINNLEHSADKKWYDPRKINEYAFLRITKLISKMFNLLECAGQA